MWKRPVMIDLQPWPFPERPRVLIELADQDRALELAASIKRAGYGVGVCRGPDAKSDPVSRCPLHQFEPCVVVEGADLVFTALDLEDEECRAVLQGLRTRYPSKPLVIAANVSDTLELGDLFAGCTVLPMDAPPEQVVEAVVAALPADATPT